MQWLLNQAGPNDPWANISTNMLSTQISYFVDTSSFTTSIHLGGIIAGWPKSFFRFLHVMLKHRFWKSPNDLFGPTQYIKTIHTKAATT